MWNNWELKRPTAYRTGPLVSCDFHFICVHRIRKKILLSPSAYRPLLFVSLLPFLHSYSCLLYGSLSSVYFSAWVGSVYADTCVLCVSALFVRACVCVCVSVLSLYSLLMYSATYILPFQVLQVLLTSQTLGTCSWACRVWMGILTKGHKSEPMYSHR